MRDYSKVTVSQNVLLELEEDLDNLDALLADMRHAMADVYPLRRNYPAQTAQTTTDRVRGMFAHGEDLDRSLRELSQEPTHREVARLLCKKVVPLLSEVTTGLQVLWDAIETAVRCGEDAHGLVVKLMPDKQIARLEDALSVMQFTERELTNE